jgi:hypothetical protein
MGISYARLRLHRQLSKMNEQLSPILLAFLLTVAVIVLVHEALVPRTEESTIIALEIAAVVIVFAMVLSDHFVSLVARFTNLVRNKERSSSEESPIRAVLSMFVALGASAVIYVGLQHAGPFAPTTSAAPEARKEQMATPSNSAPIPPPIPRRPQKGE